MTSGRWWILLCSAAFGLATTIAGVAMVVREDPGRQRLGEALLAPAFATRPGLHDFIGIGFALAFNVLVASMMCWVTLTLLELLLKAVRHVSPWRG